jgi:hypothetical protein
MSQMDVSPWIEYSARNELLYPYDTAVDVRPHHQDRYMRKLSWICASLAKFGGIAESKQNLFRDELQNDLKLLPIAILSRLFNNKLEASDFNCFQDLIRLHSNENRLVAELNSISSSDPSQWKI